MEFSDKTNIEFRGILKKYPDRKSALLPTLHLAQKEFGWISRETMQCVADLLELPVMQVYETATFYTMYNKKPVGKHHVQVCTNISCSLMGSDHIVDYLSKKLNIKPGETTKDNLFTLSEVECLGACGTAPVMMIGEDYYENLDEKSIDTVIDKLNS